LPELPEVEAVRRRLDPAMTGARFTRVTVRRPDLRIPFPRRFAARLTGETVLSMTRRAKYLAAELSSEETLLMHLGMSGSFRVERPGTGKTRTPRAEGKHDHVVFEMSNG
jgi:formamidopyrimidine-DNA glycosylase